MDAPAQFATSAFKGALETQSTAAAQIIGAGSQGLSSGPDLSAQVMAEAGKGQNLDAIG